jgi:hypothetical protein
MRQARVAHATVEGCVQVVGVGGGVSTRVVIEGWRMRMSVFKRRRIREDEPT